MILDRDRAVADFEREIRATLKHNNSSLRREQEDYYDDDDDDDADEDDDDDAPQGRRKMMISERGANAMSALVRFKRLKDRELAVFRTEEGRDAPGRGDDLPHDWWDDGEGDLVGPGLESSAGLCGEEEEEKEEDDACRLTTTL